MRPKTALVFDDNEFWRTVLSEMLGEKHFRVVAFSDPTEFLATKKQGCCCQIHEPCFDVLLTDQQMPGMTGLELLERLEAGGCRVAAHRKAIISGDLAPADLNRAQQVGCKIFFKPTPMAEIFQWLDECG
jgi:CheY-like chemotaxis protein